MMTSEFSCDLLSESKKHVEFLLCMHKLGETMSPVSAESSMRRYVELWLPLVNVETAVKGQDKVVLIPPPDVAWLWHCHRLAPNDYEDHVKRRFGCLLEATPSFAFQQESDGRSKDAKRTRDLWKKEYPSEPFFLSDTKRSTKSSAESKLKDALGGFDLLATSQNQAGFLWQVSGRRFVDDAFLKEGVDRYLKFLKLARAKKNGGPLVPTYQASSAASLFLLRSRVKARSRSHKTAAADRSHVAYAHSGFIGVVQCRLS